MEPIIATDYDWLNRKIHFMSILWTSCHIRNSNFVYSSFILLLIIRYTTILFQRVFKLFFKVFSHFFNVITCIFLPRCVTPICDTKGDLKTYCLTNRNKPEPISYFQRHQIGIKYFSIFIFRTIEHSLCSNRKLTLFWKSVKIRCWLRFLFLIWTQGCRSSLLCPFPTRISQKQNRFD